MRGTAGQREGSEGARSQGEARGSAETTRQGQQARDLHVPCNSTAAGTPGEGCEDPDFLGPRGAPGAPKLRNAPRPQTRRGSRSGSDDTTAVTSNRVFRDSLLFRSQTAIPRAARCARPLSQLLQPPPPSVAVLRRRACLPAVAARGVESTAPNGALHRQSHSLLRPSPRSPTNQSAQPLPAMMLHPACVSGSLDFRAST